MGQNQQGMRIVLIAANALCALPMAAFLGFVGYYKAFAPLAELAKHNAFTVHLPELLGRLIGWLEMGCAAALLAGLIWRAAARWQIGAALLVAGEQVWSSVLHLQHGEGAMLRQNVVLIVLLLIVALTRRTLSPSLLRS
jgi:uncharacterized membrane protein YphA (DoxX/SURF4 family)